MKNVLVTGGADIHWTLRRNVYKEVGLHGVYAWSELSSLQQTSGSFRSSVFDGLLHAEDYLEAEPTVWVNCSICGERLWRPPSAIMRHNNFYCKEHKKVTQFQRRIQQWSPTNTNEGIVDKQGRIKVYLPRHHRVDKNGYVFRSIVHYEYFNKDTVTSDYAIHHKNGNKSNDSKENLVKLKHGVHHRLHNLRPESNIKRICETCGKEFIIKQYRLNDPNNKGRFCSQSCHYKFPVSEETRRKTSQSLKKAWAEGRK